jgi:hypothetical protein
MAEDRAVAVSSSPVEPSVLSKLCSVVSLPAGVILKTVPMPWAPPP